MVEFSAFHELEAMADVEAVGSAFLERAHPDRQRGCIRLFENLSQNSGANPCSLRSRFHVQVIKQQFIEVLLEHHKTNPLPGHFDVARAAGVKAAGKTFTRTHRIKSPDALQAFTHGLDSNGEKWLQVALLRREQNKQRILIRCDGHHVRSDYHDGQPVSCKTAERNSQ